MLIRQNFVGRLVWVVSFGEAGLVALFKVIGFVDVRIASGCS